MIYLRVLWQLLLILPEMLRMFIELKKSFEAKKLAEEDAKRRKDYYAIQKAMEAKNFDEAKKAIDAIGDHTNGL